MRLPRSRQRALDRIGHSLAAEDPGLGMRFAFFTMLTRHEAMPATEQMPDRLPRFRAARRYFRSSRSAWRPCWRPVG